MNRTNRIALLAALTLVVALAGTALATRAPTAETPTPHQADEEEAPPDDAAVQRVVDKLDVDASRVRELATEHGFGGAVRLLAWEAEGVPIDEVLDRRAAGLGWGDIAKEFDVHPGIGSVMGNGGGHGRENAPGQQKDRGADD